MIPALTDDEIVALALRSDVVWAVPLLTVLLDVDALSAAGRRGMRSLGVRGLLDGSGVEPAELTSLVAAAAGAASWSAAYTAADDSRIVGASTFVFHLADGSTIVDMVSADGVHLLSRSSAGEAVGLLTALGKNVFDYGFAGSSEAVRLLIGSSVAEGWLTVRRGELVSDVATETWDAGLITSAVMVA